MARTLQGDEQMGEDSRNNSSREEGGRQQQKKNDRIRPAKATTWFVKTRSE